MTRNTHRGALAPRALLRTVPLFLWICACATTADAPSSDSSRPAGEPTTAATDPEAERIVLAMVDGEPLSLAQAMETYTSSHGGSHSVLVRGEPAVRELIGRLVEEQVFLAEADSLGVPEEEQTQDAVASYGEEMAAIVFWRREVDERVDVPEEEVEAFYAKTDEAVGLSLIVVETREEAEPLRARIAAGEDFAELAEEFSLHESASFGGSLPFVRRGEVEKPIEEAVFPLEPGGITPVVETEGGWAFARLDERIVNPMRPEPDVAYPQIRSILEARRRDELQAEVEERLRVEADVRIDESLLTREHVLAEDDVDAVVVRAAGESLTLGELRDSLKLDAVREASTEEVDGMLPELVDDWAERRAVALAVSRTGLKEDPEVAVPVDKFRRGAILKLLNRKYIYAGLEITEDEVRTYYDEHLEDGFTRSAEVRLAYMVLETEEEATEVLAAIRAGESFEDLARARSIDPNAAAHGGRVGWVRPGQILPEVEERAFALEAGELGGPVATEVGWVVLQTMDRKEAFPIPFEKARAVAARRLMTERQKEAYGVWAQRLKERADIAIYEDGIQEAVAYLEEIALEREAQEALEALEAPEGSEPKEHPIGPMPMAAPTHGGGSGGTTP